MTDPRDLSGFVGWLTFTDLASAMVPTDAGA